MFIATLFKENTHENKAFRDCDKKKLNLLFI